MQIYRREFSNYLFSLSRYSKKGIAILTDTFLCAISIWLSFYLRLEEVVNLRDLNFEVILLSVLIAIPVFWIFGLYRTLFRYAGLSILFLISLSTFVYGFIFFSIISLYVINEVPRSIGIIQPILLFLGILISRFFFKYLLTGTFDSSFHSNNKKNILIYGAGSAGKQLLLSLEDNSRYFVVGFIDDNKNLQKNILLGKKIYNISSLNRLKKKYEINLILFAIPSISNQKKKSNHR